MRARAARAHGSPAPAWIGEPALFASAYGVYAGGRWLVRGDAGDAMRNADGLLVVEDRLGVRLEDELQSVLLDTAVMPVLDHVYLGAEFLVLPAALVVLYRRARAAYRRLRTTLLATWMLALPVFALLPMAPPRLSSSAGLLDTISMHGAFALDDRVTTQFYNPFAAMPSLHCGFALALGLTVAGVASRRWVRVAAVSWPALVALSTVATGNHYVLDVVAGFAITGVGSLVASGLPVAWIRMLRKRPQLTPEPLRGRHA